MNAPRFCSELADWPSELDQQLLCWRLRLLCFLPPHRIPWNLAGFPNVHPCNLGVSNHGATPQLTHTLHLRHKFLSPQSSNNLRRCAWAFRRRSHTRWPPSCCLGRQFSIPTPWSRMRRKASPPTSTSMIHAHPLWICSATEFLSSAFQGRLSFEQDVHLLISHFPICSKHIHISAADWGFLLQLPHSSRHPSRQGSTLSYALFPQPQQKTSNIQPPPSADWGSVTSLPRLRSQRDN